MTEHVTSQKHGGIMIGTRIAIVGLTFAATFTTILSGEPLFAQQRSSTSTTQQDSILGDDFARDTGAIIVTASRFEDGNLFERVDIPEDSCLANAPALGENEPGFAIDATGMRRVRDLERIRRKTRAGTIYITGGEFVGARMKKARLYNMCFFGTDFSQTDWTGFSGSGLGFIDVDLSGAQMASTKLPYVLIRDTKLAQVDARQADWSYGRLDGGWTGSMRNLDLTGANLTNFRIACGTGQDDGCPTEREGMSLKNADLRRASFYAFFWPEVDLSGARIDQTELALDHLPSLKGARLVGPVVLRSPRRAIMLFPGEVEQLVEGAEQVEGSSDPCEGALAQPALQLICNVPGSKTRSLLASVAQLERRSMAKDGYAQRRAAWISGRNGCLDLPDEDQRINCVVAAYEARQADLRGETGAPSWVSGTGYRLFLSSEAVYPTADGQPGLYGRILPILLDSAVAAVIVKTDGSRFVSAKGVALGGCFFETDRLAYDEANGTLNFARQRRRRSPIMQEPLLSFAGQSATVREEGLARIENCSSRSDFPRLEELELDNNLLESMWERF